MQFEVTLATAFDGGDTRLGCAALGAGSRAVDDGLCRALGPNAAAGVGCPLAVDDDVATEGHRSIEAVGAAGHADEGGVALRTHAGRRVDGRLEIHRVGAATVVGSASARGHI